MPGQSLASVLVLITSPKPAAAGAVVSAILVFILTLWWTKSYLQCTDDKTAFAWVSKGDPKVNCVFNWHPVLMTLGMIVLPTMAAVAYQLPLPKKVTKPLHFGLLSGAIVFMCIGLYAVFKYHNEKSLPNWVSFHAKIGILTALLFAAQFVVGAYHFLPGANSNVPGVNAETKKMYLPIHVTAGLLMITLPIIAVASGFEEKIEFQDRFGMHIDGQKISLGKPQPSQYTDQLTLLGWIGRFLLLQLVLLVFAVRRRLPQQSDTQLSSGLIQKPATDSVHQL